MKHVFYGQNLLGTTIKSFASTHTMKFLSGIRTHCTTLPVISVSVKRDLRVFYPQNLGQDAQK